MGRAALPTMTYGALAATIRPSGPTPLAHATTARHGGAMTSAPCVIVAHHGSDIAILERDTVHLNTHGYASVTTAHRLDAVAHDMRTGYRVAIRGGLVTLLHDDTLRPVGTFRTATLERDADGWHVIALAD